MNAQQAGQLFWQEIMHTDLLTWIAVGLGVAEVLLAKANKIALYPTGILGTMISMYILFRLGLYAETCLNAYYIVMSVYGWWHWVNRQDQPPVRITWSDSRDWLTAGAIVLFGFIAGAYILGRFTNSTVPLWDAWVSATAWAGMWMLAKRKIENWILLNISNAFAIPLLVAKHSPLFAVLTLFLFIVAISGFLQWRRIVRQTGADGTQTQFT